MESEIYFLPQNYKASRCWYLCQVVKRNIKKFFFPITVCRHCSGQKQGIREVTNRDFNTGTWLFGITHWINIWVKIYPIRSLCRLPPATFFIVPSEHLPTEDAMILVCEWTESVSRDPLFCRTLGKKVLCGLALTWGSLQLSFKIFEKQSYFLPKESKATGKFIKQTSAHNFSYTDWSCLRINYAPKIQYGQMLL